MADGVTAVGGEQGEPRDAGAGARVLPPAVDLLDDGVQQSKGSCRSVDRTPLAHGHQPGGVSQGRARTPAYSEGSVKGGGVGRRRRRRWRIWRWTTRIWTAWMRTGQL